MNSKIKQYGIIVAFGVILLAALFRLEYILKFTGCIMDILLPVIVGAVLAFIINVPITKFQKLIKRVVKKELKQSTLILLSFILTLVSLMIILAFVAFAIVPKLIISVQEIYVKALDKMPIWSDVLHSYGIEIPNNLDWLNIINIEDAILKIGEEFPGLLSTIVGKASSTFSKVITIVSAIVIMFHITFSKNNLMRQIKKLIYANLRTSWADKIVYVAELIRDTYTKFLTGQFIEAIILGVLMFIALSIFRIEYAGLIAILTSICAFISCGVAVILTLLNSPEQAIVCFVVYEVVQFIENQFIYPKVVGDSVGMSPLFTFLAVLLGGKLFGIVGILFFIPLTAVVYTLVKDDTNKKLNVRHINID